MQSTTTPKHERHRPFVLLCFSAGLLLLAACAPPAENAPPSPGTLEHALRAVQIGDLRALRSGLAKDHGLCALARADMARLDPDAWLVAHGARWREYDLAAAHDARTEAAMRAAMGFSDDALTSTLLRAPFRISERYSEGRRYFRSVEPPLALLDDLKPEPPGREFSAYVVRYKATLSERTCVVAVGFRGQALTELHGAEDIGSPEEPSAAAPSFVGAAEALRGSLCDPLVALVANALPASALHLEIVALTPDAKLYWAALAARQGRWQLRFALCSTQQERLQRQQDEALKRLRESAIAFLDKHGRWPLAADLRLPEAQWVDPAEAGGERGWNVHARGAQAGFALSPAAPKGDDDVIVRATSGSVSITKSGRILR